MSWLCLVCECIHALCLSNFARPSFPSFFGWSCWLVAQLNKIAHRPLNEDHFYTSLFASPYKFGAPDCILGPDLGPILVLVFGSIFGSRFGALDFVCNCRGPKRCPKMEPETGTKIWPKSGPQNAIRGSKFVLRREQGLHDLHSAVCWAIGFNCATN